MAWLAVVLGEDVARLMQPFHKVEHDGVADEYVVQVDITAEARATYEADTEARIRGPDGTLHSPDTIAPDREPTAAELARLEAELARLAALPQPDRRLIVSMDRGPLPDGPLPQRERFPPGGAIDVPAADDGPALTFYRLRTPPHRVVVHAPPLGFRAVAVPVRELMPFRDWIARAGLRSDARDPSGWAEHDARGEVIHVVSRTNPNGRWHRWTVGGDFAGLLLVKPGAGGTRSVSTCRVGEVDWEAMLQRARTERTSTWARATRERDARIADAPALRDTALDSMRLRYDLREEDTLARYVARAVPLEPFAIVSEGRWLWHPGGWEAPVGSVAEYDAWRTTAAATLRAADPHTPITLVEFA